MSDIRQQASDVAARGGELAVHGIDAWREMSMRAGRGWRSDLTGATAANGPHALAKHRPRFCGAAREQTGFAYDSTWGYNDAVGYRAGTSQVFVCPGARGCGLPLSIMDSALFYPGRMGLTQDEALRLCRAIRWQTRATSGAGTVVESALARSRVLAPERLWGRCYPGSCSPEVEDGDRAWFATAGEAVDWFRWRRSMQLRCGGAGERDHRRSPPAALDSPRGAA